ncbi:MAG: rhomboid family intramembrane serine protease [Pseudobdellovibrionaceae bacterium]
MKNGHDPDSNVIAFKRKERQASPEPGHEPFINLPPLTKILVAGIVFIHIALWLCAEVGASQITLFAYSELSFIPARFSGVAPFEPWSFLTPITYAFLHHDWLHISMNALMLLALCAGYEKQEGASRTLCVFFSTSVLAIFLQFCFAPSSTIPVVGASGGISGLFGALMAMLYLSGRFGDQGSLLRAVIVFIVISVIVGLIGGPGGAMIAWIAHIGGFLSGIALTFFWHRKT